MDMNSTQSHPSLRDYFAAHAMNSLMHYHPATCVRGSFHSIARSAYIMADLMILAREGKIDEQ